MARPVRFSNWSASEARTVNRFIARDLSPSATWARNNRSLVNTALRLRWRRTNLQNNQINGTHAYACRRDLVQNAESFSRGV
jgi:hypothetical protein